MVAPVSAPRKNRRSTLLERRYAVALREDMGLSYDEISRVTGFSKCAIRGWDDPTHKKRRSQIEKRYREKNPGGSRFKSLKNESKKYGYAGPSFSVYDLDRFLQCHSGACDLCGRCPKRVALHIEHCHQTGALRGLVCARCNHTIAGLETVGVEKFLDYLAKPPIAGGK